MVLEISMKRSIPYFTLVLFIFLASCASDKKDESQLQREEIIKYHDEVMPLMGKLKNLEKKANQEIQRLEESEEPDSARIESLKSLAYDLDAAYEGMFDWMHQYDVSDGERTPEELKKFLDEQLVKIKAVNEQFKEVLAKSDELLEN